MLSSIIMTRLGVHLQSVGFAEQSAVTSSHGCVDAAVILEIALQSLKASNQKHIRYVTFEDLVNGFGSVHHEMMWK
jgi:hypothetical protein